MARALKGSNGFGVAMSPAPAPPYLEDYQNRGCRPDVKEQITDMAVNGAGVRDTARVLKVSLGTVIEELKKEDRLQSVNQLLLLR